MAVPIEDDNTPPVPRRRQAPVVAEATEEPVVRRRRAPLIQLSDAPDEEPVVIDDSYTAMGSATYPHTVSTTGAIQPTTAQFGAAFSIFKAEYERAAAAINDPHPGTLDASEPGVGKSVTMAVYAYMHYAWWRMYMWGNASWIMYNRIYVCAINAEILQQLQDIFTDVFSNNGATIDRDYVRFILFSELFDELYNPDTPARCLVMGDELHGKIGQDGMFKQSRGVTAGQRGLRNTEGGNDESGDADTQLYRYVDEVTADPGLNKISKTWGTTATILQNNPEEMDSILLFLNRFERLPADQQIPAYNDDEPMSRNLSRMRVMMSKIMEKNGFTVVYFPSPVRDVLFATGDLSYDRLDDICSRIIRGEMKKVTDDEGMTRQVNPSLGIKFKTDELTQLNVQYSDAQEVLHETRGLTELTEKTPTNPITLMFGVSTEYYGNDQTFQYGGETFPIDTPWQKSPKLTAYILEHMELHCKAILYLWIVEKVAQHMDFFTENPLVEAYMANLGFPGVKGYVEIQAKNADQWTSEDMIREYEEKGTMFVVRLTASGRTSRLVLDWYTLLDENVPIIGIISDKLSVGINFSNSLMIGIATRHWQPAKLIQIIYRILRANYMGKKRKRVMIMSTTRGEMAPAGALTVDQIQDNVARSKYEIADALMGVLLNPKWCVSAPMLPYIPRGTIVHPEIKVDQGALYDVVMQPSYMPVSSTATSKDVGFWIYWLSYYGINPAIFSQSRGRLNSTAVAILSANPIISSAYHIQQTRASLMAARNAAVTGTR